VTNHNKTVHIEVQQNKGGFIVNSILAHCNVLMLPLILMLAACTNLGEETPLVPTTTEEPQQTCVEDYKLLAMDGIVFNDGSSVRVEYSILDQNNDLVKGKESYNSWHAKYDMNDNFIPSMDGKRLLRNNNGYYEVLNLKGDTIFRLDVFFESANNCFNFSPNLNYFFVFDMDKNAGTIYNTQDKTTCEIPVEDYQSFTFSDDGSSFGYIRYDESSGENSIIIHDSKSGRIIHRIPIEGKESTTFINQIHNHKKVLYTYMRDAYMTDFDGGNKTLLGHNIFFTQLSEDEKYLAYSKTYANDQYVEVDDSELDTLESDDERGLYIENMLSGETKFFPYLQSENVGLRPVMWLSFSEE
jgi:hypothetical protein